MNDDNQPATKADVEEIVTKAIDVTVPGIVSGIVEDATDKILGAVGDQLQTMNSDIDERFDELDERFDRLANDHATRISKLEQTAGISKV